MSEKKEILIVEEEEILLKLQSLLLSSRGYLVKGVSSGKLALVSLAKKKPDLVVLDLSREAPDAFELCRQIKESTATRDIPVIIMSARQSAEEAEKCERSGADWFIAKPFRSSLLVNAVYRLLSGKAESRVCFS